MNPAITIEMLRAASSEEFPVIDLGGYMRGDAGALDRVAAQLREALENIGFLIVVNHGVSPTLTDGIVEEARRFHALPLGEKLNLATGRGQGSGFTGYLAVGRLFGQDLRGQRQRPARPQRSLLHGPRACPRRP